MPGSKAQPAPEVHRFDEPHRDIAGKRWYNGVGSPNAEIVFVDSWPGDEIKRTNRPLGDRVGRCLQWLLRLADISPARCYYTYAVKFPFGAGRKPSSADKALCATMLREEIDAVNPRVVVAFGADAWAAVAGMHFAPAAKPMTDEDRHAARAEIAMARFQGPDNPPTGEVDSDGVQLRKRGYFEIANEVTDEEVLAHWMASGGSADAEPIARAHPFACCRGEPVAAEGRTLFPTYNLAQVMMNGGEGYKDRRTLADIPQHVLVHSAVRELRLVKRIADGEDLKATYASHRPVYDVLTTPEDVDFVHEQVMAMAGGRRVADGLLCLDCEWDGRNWLDPGRYIRTIQIGYAKGRVAIVKLHEAGGLPSHPDTKAVLAAVKRWLEDPRCGIVGHNVISDGEWLLEEGIDIRPRVVYDTMLGEYLLCEDGPFGLEEAAMKYASYGRYCSELECWVKRHGKECKLGFGNVPDSILLPYGAADVDCLRYIMAAQLPMLEKIGYLKPRGVGGEYPSMLQTTLNTQRVVYEIERTGLPVDRERLDMLIDIFQSKKAELLAQVVTGAAEAGMPDFNPGSSAQVRTLLFQKLGLTPVKTTAGKDWAEAVGNWGLDEDIDESPGTDKQTLEILGDAHPLVRALLQYRRVEQYTKTWLRHKDAHNQDRGLEAQMWADGRLHSHMSQLSTTSRFKSSSPNCFPAEVEVLTDRGWLHWDEAYALRDTDIRLAQWDVDSPHRRITFARPEAWHSGRNRLIRVRTRQQIDIVATPEHKFEVFSRRDPSKHKTVTTEELATCSEYLIPQAGHLAADCGNVHLSHSDVVLVCAMQADGYVVPQGGVEFAFTKQRKVERLRAALDFGGWSYRMSTDRSASGKPRTRFYVGKRNNGRSLAQYKRLGDWLLRCDADSLWRLSQEVFEWDGCHTGGTRSNYASAVKSNTDWVQILQLLFDRRAHFREYADANGGTSYQVDVSDHPLSHLANASCEHLPEADVYCVTMPQHSVIVRYNGRVLFTKQSQNFPKKAEGFFGEIFGKDNVPPVIRTVVVPPPGMVMMEADFQQAELFTIASLSGDPHMIDMLRTPGRDMHTSISAKAFGYHMFDENHKEWTEDDVVELVRTQYGGDAENKEFKTWQKHLVFRDAHGNELTYAQYKAGPRISGKNVNFGILYGRGGRDTAIQVKAETGAAESIDVLAAQLDQVIKTWKEVEYPVAWAFIESCMAKVYDPGYIKNPFGRIRRAPFLLRGQRDAGAERNFANFPIQSTVSDAVQLAMDRMQAWRVEHNMHFEIQNQIHDAVMLHVPKDEIEETKYMFHHTLGDIHIPLGPDRYFSLGVDIDVYERWGQKVKD